MQVFSVLSWIGTVAGTAYFVYNEFWLNWTMLTIPNLMLLVGIGAGIIAFSITDDEEPRGWTCVIAAVLVICSYIAFPLGISEYRLDKAWDAVYAERDAYNANIKPVEEPKYQEDTFELLSATDGSRIEGTLKGELNGSLFKNFFVARGSVTGTIDGELRQFSVYQIYYYAENGAVRTMTLNSDDTDMFFIEDGESPYLLKKTWTKYSLNYNVEPPEECAKSETIVYELHVPKGSIIEGFIFDLQG